MSLGLEAVFHENREPLVRFLRVRGAGDHAEDLAHEVWIRAATITAGPISNPRAYLFRIAHNLMIDNHRAEQQRGHRQNQWSQIHFNVDTGASSEPSIEQTLSARAVLAKANQCIDELGEPTATILRRFRIDEVAQKTIAADLGVSLATVEKHLQKAYRTMLALKLELDTE